MSVVRFLCECGPTAQACPPASDDATVAIRRADLDGGADRDSIAALLRAAAWPSASPKVVGFLGELSSRTGREIAVWLADERQPGANGDRDPPRTVGLVAVARTRGGWSIPWLLVHPEARRHGVGRVLVTHAVEHARSQGAAGVTAESLDSWPDAVAFWQAVGFGRRPTTCYDRTSGRAESGLWPLSDDKDRPMEGNRSSRQEFENDIDSVRRMQEDLVRGAGGTPGGTWLFFTGLVLAAAGLWFFLSNVHVVTQPLGLLSGVFSRGAFGGGMPSMSTGIVFAPIFLGLVFLFYDARMKWGWALFYVGLALIVIEILSRIQFMMDLKTSNLLLMLGMIAAGIGMMLRSFRDDSQAMSGQGQKSPPGAEQGPTRQGGPTS